MTFTAVLLASAISATVAYRFGAQRNPVAPRPAARAVAAAEADAPCIAYTEANAHVGQPACVTGRVLKVVTSKSGNTYLDFCEDYRACPFSSVIFSQDRAKFGDLATLQGQFVEIRGLVSYYKERPQIIIRAPEQLKLRE
jgi:hypothetical protein